MMVQDGEGLQLAMRALITCFSLSTNRPDDDELCSVLFHGVPSETMIQEGQGTGVSWVRGEAYAYMSTWSQTVEPIEESVWWNIDRSESYWFSYCFYLSDGDQSTWREDGDRPSSGLAGECIQESVSGLIFLVPGMWVRVKWKWLKNKDQRAWRGSCLLAKWRYTQVLMIGPYNEWNGGTLQPSTHVDKRVRFNSIGSGADKITRGCSLQWEVKTGMKWVALHCDHLLVLQ